MVIDEGADDESLPTEASIPLAHLQFSREAYPRAAFQKVIRINDLRPNTVLIFVRFDSAV